MPSVSPSSSTPIRIWSDELGDSPLVAVAVHDGHALRDEVAKRIALPEAERLREEDPFTGGWTVVAPTRVIGTHSRFEVDLNRPREGAVYRRPEDAWGLDVWEAPVSDALVAASLAEYDAFYARLHEILRGVEARHGRFFVFDLHTYNHRRDGADAPPAPEIENPQVNIGTGTMERSRWSGLVDRFIAELRAHPFPGGGLDVRENVRFRGGNIPRWVHAQFPQSGCALAIEFKKFFMDEWTGAPDEALVEAITGALRSTVPGVLEELGR